MEKQPKQRETQEQKAARDNNAKLLNPNNNIVRNNRANQMNPNNDPTGPVAKR